LINLLRWLSAIAFICALASLVLLISLDVVDRLRPGLLHQQAGALSLMLIGASYICLQLSLKRPWVEICKGCLLGLAFLLWGAEQFVPSGAWVTMMDSAVVTIFVVDLSVIILERLRRKDNETS